MEEQEVMCLSSDSSTSLVSDTDESEDEILNERDKALEYLETFTWGEGVSLKAPVMREKERCLKLALKLVGCREEGWVQAGGVPVHQTCRGPGGPAGEGKEGTKEAGGGEEENRRGGKRDN